MIRKIDISQVHLAEEIWYLQHTAFREEAVRVGIKVIPPLMDTIEALQRCKEQYIGYELDGEIIGALAYDLQGSKLSIRRLMVQPVHFRRGIASSLLDYVLTKIPHKQAEVYAGERNDPAVSLYRKYGFVPIEQLNINDGFQLTRFIRS
jgi:ribosomal protein S18 acetylase RimI-like enzyme